jgi:hypothetical protein
MSGGIDGIGSLLFSHDSRIAGFGRYDFQRKNSTSTSLSPSNSPYGNIYGDLYSGLSYNQNEENTSGAGFNPFAKKEVELNPLDQNQMDHTKDLLIYGAGKKTVGLVTTGATQVYNFTANSYDKFFNFDKINYSRNSKDFLFDKVDNFDNKLLSYEQQIQNKTTSTTSFLAEKALNSDNKISKFAKWTYESKVGKAVRWLPEKATGLKNTFSSMANGRGIKGAGIFGLYSAAASYSENLKEGEYFNWNAAGEASEAYMQNMVADRTISATSNLAKTGYVKIKNLSIFTKTSEAVNTADDVANTAAKSAQAATNTSQAASTSSSVANAADDVANAAARSSQFVSNTSQAANASATAANTSQATSGTTSTAANSVDDIARAAANSADDAANVLSRAAQVANATTAETQAALNSTTFLTKCGNAVSKFTAVLNSPAAKLFGKVLAPLAPALETVDGISKISEANQALQNRENLSEQEISQLESKKAEGITKTAIGGGALAVGTGLLLASNPIGWTVMAGAGIYALADLGAKELFGKSISSAISDGVSSAYNTVKENPKLLYATPLAPVKAVYDAYNYFFGDDEEPAKKASAPATATVKVKPTPPKDLLKAMNLDPEKDKNKYSYEINNDVLKIQLEVNKKIKEVNKDLPNEHDLKALSCDGKLGKQTLLKMHELGLDDEALKITGLRKQAYNELIDLTKKSQYSNDPKQKEEATKLADIHMKRINSKDNYGKTYSSNDLAIAVNSIKDKKTNPLSVKANLEKSKHNSNAEIKGRFDVSSLIPESMRHISAESTAVNIPLSHVEREISGDFTKKNPSQLFTSRS